MPSIPPLLGEASEPSLGGKDCVTRPLKGVMEEPGNTTILKKIKLVTKNEVFLKNYGSLILYLLAVVITFLKSLNSGGEKEFMVAHSYFPTCIVLLDED